MTDTYSEQLILLRGAVVIENGVLSVRDHARLSTPHMDELAREAVFGRSHVVRENTRWIIWELAQASGIRPASIHDLYVARGRGECGGFTVPAINVRGLTYETARSIFRTAVKLNVGAFICEIARSEIAYTEQRPGEYVAVLLAAAIREGFRGPVFIQGDHFQLNAKKFAADPEKEVDAVKQLADEAVGAGFYNIDIDTSTLVDLSKPTLVEQQRVNVERAVELAAFVRGLERETFVREVVLESGARVLERVNMTISLGGEIGEVGTQNSTPEELRTYMDGFNALLAERAPGAPGLSKISVQSGTSHGGVVLPDGSIADVKIDFDTLATLSKIAREEYGLAGAVQHGASTLPDAMFHKFPGTETCEIHLATNFQTMLYDHMPRALRDEIYAWLDANAKDERKPSDTDEQFYYKTRKKALGPFKRAIWDLPEDTKAALAEAYDKKFEFLFTQLNVVDTAGVVSTFVRTEELHRPIPYWDEEEAEEVRTAPDDPDLSD